jgi:cytochrome c oxidase subunit 2
MERHKKTIMLALAAVVAVSGCSGGASELSETATRGQEVAATRGCMACHGEDGAGDVGPAWQGLFGAQVLLEGGATVTVDEDYLRRAIVDPEAEVVAGVTITMPTTSLTEAEVEALIVYIKELE